MARAPRREGLPRRALADRRCTLDRTRCTQRFEGGTLTWRKGSRVEVVGTRDASSGIFDRVAAALGKDTDDALTDTTDTSLTMARYVPSRFLRTDGEAAQYQVQNAGLLRSALLRRFESSHVAFARTLTTTIQAHDAFLDALDQGRVLIGDALREWAASDSDDSSRTSRRSSLALRSSQHATSSFVSRSCTSRPKG